MLEFRPNPAGSRLKYPGDTLNLGLVSFNNGRSGGEGIHSSGLQKYVSAGGFMSRLQSPSVAVLLGWQRKPGGHPH